MWVSGRCHAIHIQRDMMESPLVALSRGAPNHTPHFSRAVSAPTDESVPSVTELNAVNLVIVCIHFRDSTHSARLVETINSQNMFSASRE